MSLTKSEFPCFGMCLNFCKSLGMITKPLLVLGIVMETVELGKDIDVRELMSALLLEDVDA